MAMSTGSNEAGKWRFQLGIGQIVGRNMGGNVIDPEKWKPRGKSQTFGIANPDQ